MTQNGTGGKVVDATVESYSTSLREPYRPPSKGGNTSALHAHYLTIDGDVYSFLALGSRQWVYQNDTVSFEWELKKEKYRDILKDTLVTRDRNMNEVVRGNRGSKQTLRTAPARLPGSRREQRS